MMRAYKQHFPHTCPICGNDFLGVKQAKYCSDKCKKNAETTAVSEANQISALRARSKKSEERLAMKARLAARDAAYERDFPGMQSGDVRGRIAAGGRCGVIRDNCEGAMVRKYIAPTSEL